MLILSAIIGRLGSVLPWTAQMCLRFGTTATRRVEESGIKLLQSKTLCVTR